MEANGNGIHTTINEAILTAIQLEGTLYIIKSDRYLGNNAVTESGVIPGASGDSGPNTLAQQTTYT